MKRACFALFVALMLAVMPASAQYFPPGGGGGGGGIILPSICGYRVSLVSGVPITTSDESGSMLYSTINSVDAGNHISLFYNSAWGDYEPGELNLNVSGLSDGLYDLVEYYNGTAVTLGTSAAWASSNTRTNAIAQLNGVWVLSSDHTKRVIATFKVVGGVVYDTAGTRGVWNFQNQATRLLRGNQATSWFNNSQTIVPSNSNTTDGQGRVSVVRGLDDKPVDVSVMLVATAASSDPCIVSIGVDTTTAFDAECVNKEGGGSSAIAVAAESHLKKYAGIGDHFFQQVEASYAGSGGNFMFGLHQIGGIPGLDVRNGIYGEVFQ